MDARLDFVLLAGLTLIGGQAPTSGEHAAALRDPKHALWSRPAPEIYRVQMDTTKGKIVLEITRSMAPRGADRFYHLVETGFYNDSRFFASSKGDLCNSASPAIRRSPPSGGTRASPMIRCAPAMCAEASRMP